MKLLAAALSARGPVQDLQADSLMVGKYPTGGRGGAGHIDPGGRVWQRREHSAGHEHHHVVEFPGAGKHGDQDFPP